MKYLRIIAKFRDGGRVFKEESPLCDPATQASKELTLDWLERVQRQHRQAGHVPMADRVVALELP